VRMATRGSQALTPRKRLARTAVQPRSRSLSTPEAWP
jgi:hypothetical protein